MGHCMGWTDSSRAGTPRIIYTVNMQDYYILRLHKDLRIALEKERNRLYAMCGDRSLLAWEPCIILGPDSGNVARIIPSPPLPVIVKGAAQYTNGILHLPLADPAVLDRTREFSNHVADSWHFQAPWTSNTNGRTALRSLSFAILETTATSWRICQERRLHSDKYR